MLRLISGLFCVALALAGPSLGGPYVTEASGVRWNDVGGVRWNDVGGVRWNDVGGVRWNDVGGVRWNDVGGLLFTEASGVRWNDVGGVRWNDVGSIVFADAVATGQVSIDLDLLNAVSALPDTSTVNVIVTYVQSPTQADLDQLVLLGIPGGTVFRRLPMVVISATKQQIQAIAQLSGVRSIYSNKTLSFFDDASNDQIGLDDVAADVELRGPDGGALSGAGVTIAVLDSGVDAAHPDLPLGSKVVENVVLASAPPAGIGFNPPSFLEGQTDTDPTLGHGTFVASVAAGTGQASAGRYAGVAPGAAILGLSAGQWYIISVLEGFDYLLANQDRFDVRVLNCSWGTVGWFDPDDPVNVATRLLHDAGINVVFAAGNHGPSPDTLNPYSVAPWVIGVGSVGDDGRLSSFSSRGIFEELIYHPTLVAPGEGIVAAKAGLVETVGGVAGVANTSAGESVPAEFADDYAVSSGTSYAAPHVAGVIALMLEAEPGLTPAGIKRRLQQSATPFLTRTRFEVGAGALDAWAAVAAAVDDARPFGSHYPGWLDERPYRIEHQDPLVLNPTVVVGTTEHVPLALPATALASQFHLAWGDDFPLHDLDLRIVGPGNEELARSESISGLGLFGRAEGASLLGGLPQAVTAIVSFKSGIGVADQSFSLRHETAVATLMAYDDLAGLDPAELAIVTTAVSRGVIVGRDGAFEPDALLLRGELARSLALAGGVPQRIPSSRTFHDVQPDSADFPYIETVSGARATEEIVPQWNANQFRPSGSVRRIDLAVAIVRAAGLTSEAESRAGEALTVSDGDSIPFIDRGYVAIALERELIAPVDGAFEPKQRVTRLEACASLLALLDMRDAPNGKVSTAAGYTHGARHAPAPGRRAAH